MIKAKFSQWKKRSNFQKIATADFTFDGVDIRVALVLSRGSYRGRFFGNPPSYNWRLEVYCLGERIAVVGNINRTTSRQRCFEFVPKARAKDVTLKRRIEEPGTGDIKKENQE